MRRSVLLRLCPLFLFAILCCSILARTSSPGERAKPPSPRKIAQLIEDLDSDRFAVREAATRTLLELDDEPPALREARKTADLELRRRLDLILEAHLEKRAHRGLKRACLLAKEGRVDEMVERLVLWQRWNSDEKEWKRLVAELGVRLMEWEHSTVGSNPFLAKGRFPSLESLIPLEFRRQGHSKDDAYTPKEFVDMWKASRHRLGHEIKMGDRDNLLCTFLASRDVTITLMCSGIIIMSGGKVHLSSQISNSIIVCDGDLDVSDHLVNCLVIVRGTISFKEVSRIIASTVFSGGYMRSESSIVKIEPGSMLAAKIPNSPVKFFDLAALGLAVRQFKLKDHKKPDKPQNPDDRQHLDFRSVEITELRKDSPFASVLRAADVITGIDETKTPSPEVFRKILRRKLAEGGPVITFTVYRAGKTLEVSIPVKD